MDKTPAMIRATATICDLRSRSLNIMAARMMDTTGYRALMTATRLNIPMVVAAVYENAATESNMPMAHTAGKWEPFIFKAGRL